MHLLQYIFPAKRRVRRKRRAVPSSPTPPPPAANQIVSIALGPASNQVTATLGNPLVAVDNPTQGMWVNAQDTDPVGAQSAAVSVDQKHVTFTFDVDVDNAIAWHVEDPGVWEWLDGTEMLPPFDGSISP